MLRLLFLSLALCAACSLLSCGRQSVVPDAAPPAAGPQAGLAGALPALEALAYPTQPARHVSATTFELLDNAPLYMSSSGASYSPGQLDLNPFVAGEGYAWAIFPLYGFPGDKSIYPVSYALTASGACWVGYANYIVDHWQFTETLDANPVSYASGADLLSPAGVHYVALIASEEAVTATGLLLTASGDLQDAPVAVLNVLSQVVAGMPADFSALGSSPGGSAFESITFDWGDSSPDTVITDPTQEVQHTYTNTGNRTVKLTVSNVNTQSASTQQAVTVGNPMRELLLVYNADIPEDLDLANYYASPRTGRAVDPEYILGIHPTEEGRSGSDHLGELPGHDPRSDQSLPRLQIRRSRTGIKYILLCKGIPLKIYGENQFTFDNLIPGHTTSPLVSYSIVSPRSTATCACCTTTSIRSDACTTARPTWTLLAHRVLLERQRQLHAPIQYKVTWVDYSDIVAPYTIVQYTLKLPCWAIKRLFLRQRQADDRPFACG